MFYKTIKPTPTEAHKKKRIYRKSSAIKTKGVREVRYRLRTTYAAIVYSSFYWPPDISHDHQSIEITLDRKNTR